MQSAPSAVLGGIGVASAIHAYIKQKIGTIAVLRCLGAVARQTFYIYLIQALAMGLIGSIIGVLIGLGVMNFLPLVLGDFLPVDLAVRRVTRSDDSAVGQISICWPSGKFRTWGKELVRHAPQRPVVSVRLR